MTTTDRLQAVADALYDAGATGIAIPLPSATIAGLDAAGARTIARAVDDRRRAAGDRLIGYKLGWTSAVMRDALGIDRPNWGTLWESQRVGATLDLASTRHPKIEPELVFVTGRPLAGPDVTTADVQAATAGWMLGLEIVHPRFESFDFTWLDNTADNSSAHAVAVGSIADAVSVAEPAAVTVHFGRSGDPEVRAGSGTATMGSPTEAVAWLVRGLAGEGGGLEAGQIVFTGGLTAPHDLEPGVTYRLEANGFDPIAVSVTAIA